MGNTIIEEEISIEWLHKLPLAPTFYPTDTEFADPIAYISKIEKEASLFGICKVIPPLPKPSKKYVFSNLNKSLSRFPGLDQFTSRDTHHPVFTTRHQELGKKTKGDVHKQVWQSGQVYTLEQFESKAKVFARNQLGTVKEVSPLDVEALFWKAASEESIYIEYANDVPGSGFGEPEKVCHYFHRRRRRRQQFNQNHQESPHHEKQNTDNLSMDRFTKQKASTNIGIDGEGTAGWKLSNSPWNLQVISRSPGSLTRFMLDDIPGVTSPMIYIGMLFSWFAWHVEDHELHSLNFLHTGSPKTWYAVPGDYAFHFEDVIRSKGYGGNLDRLAALTLLGEKTNLLSPEVVIASGIPCCRLVQNPGEYVVTFPRAYHIGFSHGFNCGEAANFGTPQWLKVAKAAAVRRAAMNYLPMLSHQQLLYMLTMSFVSRVPKILLSGARSSRLKDRQKEQRELLVKKAFIDDMLNEKYLLSVLGKKSSFYAVLWDPEALPSPESPPIEPSIVSGMSIERCSGGYQNNGSYSSHVCSTRPSMEPLQDIYADEDDLPCGLHVDSGILPCVACGVLGFPFMSIVQPSRKASEALFPEDYRVSQSLDDLGSIKSSGHKDLYDAPVKSVSDARNCDENENVSPMCRRDEEENCVWRFYSDAANKNLEGTSLNCSLVESADGERDKKWITCNEFLRPRVFCLEHAFEVEKLLHSKGGANMLIICHTAYEMINAQALAVAEEIGVPFNTDEIPPLRCASKEDIDLISISMDGDGHEEEDWTSKLGINLGYCVKLKKLSPSKDEQQHALLALGGLFCDHHLLGGGLDPLVQWKSRRSRTPSHSKLSVGPSSEQVEKVNNTSPVKQYSRRNSKRKAGEGRSTDEERKVSIAKESNNNNNNNKCSSEGGMNGDPKLAETGVSGAVESCVVSPICDVELTVKGVDSPSFLGVDNCVEKSTVQQHHVESDLSNNSPQVGSGENVDMTSKMPQVEEDEAMEPHASPSHSAAVETLPLTNSRTTKRGRENENSSYNQNGFIKSPCEGLRPRTSSSSRFAAVPLSASGPEAPKKKAARKSSNQHHHQCDINGCGMKFKTEEELTMHKRNRCPHKGCGKQFRSHKYALLHQRVHEDERPLKCSWKGCTMSFKWAWARTEHMRVHTGERPYQCNHQGCTLTFRFVSDISRHRRRTGHH
ncbi:hypothetical protein ACHQM5_020586 [Ranunculus cassubicifolius]